MFLTLFLIAKIRNQPQCPSTDAKTKKVYIHSGILSNSREEGELVICNTWMTPENTQVKEVRHRKTKTT